MGLGHENPKELTLRSRTLFTSKVSVDIAISVANVRERRVLEGLQRRASLENAGDRKHLLEHPDAIALPVAQLEAGQVFVARSGSLILGFAALEVGPHGDIELDGLFVEPSHWRSGIGSALIDFCCEVARKQGARALYVIANPHAKPFYIASGFNTEGARRTRFGEAIAMKKSL